MTIGESPADEGTQNMCCWAETKREGMIKALNQVICAGVRCQ